MPKRDGCSHDGIVDLTGAHVQLLRDTGEVSGYNPWDGVVPRLRGFHLTHLADPGDVERRLEWLQACKEYPAGVYEQIAGQYTSAGQPQDARRVRHRSACRAHDSLRRDHKVIWTWNWIPRVMVGFWEKPWLAVYWLIGLVGMTFILSLLTDDFGLPRASTMPCTYCSPPWRD
jgi:hypothetical protein